MPLIDPAIEFAYWLELARDTYARGHHKLASQILGTARNEYAALTAASTHLSGDPPAQGTVAQHDESEEVSSDRRAMKAACKAAGGKLAKRKGARR
jgi:hypothetical protein